MTLALTKKDCISFVNNEQQILFWIIAPAFSKILWHLPFMLIFRVDVLSSLKTDNIKPYHKWMSVYIIYLNIGYENVYPTPGISNSVKNVRVAVY